MALIKDELKVISIKELLEITLKIPPYQRPYRWSKESTNTLFNDIYNAFKNDEKKYRLGSVILYKSSKEKAYFIIDGQQRVTTLCILLFVLGEKQINKLILEEVNPLSKRSIIENAKLLYTKMNDLNNIVNFQNFLLKNCEVVKVVTDDEQEAFQFFDSQNTRGKALDPHDILKSYHLREMKGDNESLQLSLITEWERKKQSNIAALFATHLYPLTQWYKKNNGLYYSTTKIEIFKGIKNGINYNYAIYQKSAQSVHTDGGKQDNTNFKNFQLTQSVLAGQGFFNYTLYYLDLLDKVKNIITSHIDSDKIPNSGNGDRYTKELFENTLLFFADRFGVKSLSKNTVKKFYSWAYSIRVVMYAVYKETINAYALGNGSRINNHLNMFTLLSEMKTPEELDLVLLDPLTEKTPINVKYDYISQYIKGDHNE